MTMDISIPQVPRRGVSLRPGNLSLSVAKSQADRIEVLLAENQRNGCTDMTVREVCEAYQRVWDVLLFPGQAEARLAALEAAGRVICEREEKRECRITRNRVKSYHVPHRQAEAF